MKEGQPPTVTGSTTVSITYRSTKIKCNPGAAYCGRPPNFSCGDFSPRKRGPRLIQRKAKLSRHPRTLGRCRSHGQPLAIPATSPWTAFQRVVRGYMSQHQKRRKPGAGGRGCPVVRCLAPLFSCSAGLDLTGRRRCIFPCIPRQIPQRYQVIPLTPNNLIAISSIISLHHLAGLFFPQFIASAISS